jgi:hypothetical protein
MCTSLHPKVFRVLFRLPNLFHLHTPPSKLRQNLSTVLSRKSLPLFANRDRIIPYMGHPYKASASCKSPQTTFSRRTANRKHDSCNTKNSSLFVPRWLFCVMLRAFEISPWAYHSRLAKGTSTRYKQRGPQGLQSCLHAN